MWRSQSAGNKMSANENFTASLDLIYQVMISVVPLSTKVMVTDWRVLDEK